MKISQVEIGRIVESITDLRREVFKSGSVSSPALTKSYEVLKELGITAGKDVFEQERIDNEDNQ